MMKVNVYRLVDPRNGAVRYVGVTRRTIQYRCRGHIKEAEAGHKSHKCSWIRQLLGRGLRPLVELIEVVDRSESEEREKFWITFYKETVTNVQEGGHAYPSEETLARISASMQGFMTDEQKQKIAKSRTGKKHSPTARANISEGLRGRKLSDETKQKIRKALTTSDKSRFGHQLQIIGKALFR
jgi:hypothetical protein